MPVFAHRSIHPQRLVHKSHSITVWWMNESSWLYCSHFYYGNYHPKTGFTNYPVSLPTTLWTSKAQELSFQLYIANAQPPKICLNSHKRYKVLYMCFWIKVSDVLQINSKRNRRLPLEDLILHFTSQKWLNVAVSGETDLRWEVGECFAVFW